MINIPRVNFTIAKAEAGYVRFGIEFSVLMPVSDGRKFIWMLMKEFVKAEFGTAEGKR